ncbi:MAG: phospholipid carrier-dependent glycosyltransferase [Anaerolineales bacterium]|nr:phospholipid carrier-dependent glycosyltransferase [Anaerolineales bacterium]
MLVILPVIAFVTLWLLWANFDRDSSWRQSALRSAILCGVFGILSAEILSLVSGITPLGLGLSWSFLILVAIYALRKQHLKTGSIQLPTIRFPQSWFDRVLIVGILVIIIITGVLGLLSPPQSVDSLHYHMSRIAHWAQERSIWHFATGIRVENSLTPGAEILMLHPYVLSQSDYLVNSVQWMAMILSVIGASLIAKQLGGNRKAEIISAVFVVSLPMGIAQASNTLNDYVAAFWVICATSEALNLIRRRTDKDWKSSLVFLSLASSLVYLTKATALPFLAFSGIAVILFILKRDRRRDTIRWVAFGCILIAVVIAGYLIQNAITYSSLIDVELLNTHRNELITLRGVLSNTVKNAGLHAGTPWQRVNAQIYRIISIIHSKLRIDFSDPRTTSIGFFAINRPITDEAYTGNNLHAYIILASLFLAVLQRKSIGTLAILYGVAFLGSFVLFSAMYKWQIIGSRYHLPFFVLVSPFVACVVCSFQRQYLNNLVGIILLLSTWPWLFGLRSRPIIPSASDTPFKSVLSEPRESLYTVNVPWVEDQYRAITDEINRIQCSRVGFMLGGSAMEYLLWVQLGAPRDDLEIQWIVSGTPSERYLNEDFSPCAIVCENCPQDLKVMRGLPLLFEHGNLRIFASETVE